MPFRKYNKKTIIVVEDDDAINDVIKVILTDFGYSVVQCFCAKDLWKILHSIKPDLVTMDYWISSANGIRLCKEMREDEELSKIPVLFITGAEFDTSELDKLDDVSYLTKPFRIEVLLDKVRSIVGD